MLWTSLSDRPGSVSSTARGAVLTLMRGGRSMSVTVVVLSSNKGSSSRRLPESLSGLAMLMLCCADCVPPRLLVVVVATGIDTDELTSSYSDAIRVPPPRRPLDGARELVMVIRAVLRSSRDMTPEDGAATVMATAVGWE